MPPRQLFYYEAPEDGGGGAPPPEPAPEPVDQPVAGDAEGAAEAQAWALSQDDWEATVNYLRQTAPIIQQAAAVLQQQQYQPQQQEQYQQPAAPEFDPFDPDSVQAYINANIQQGLQQGIAPYTQLFNSMAESEGERLAQTTMQRLDTEVGSFDHDAAYMIAAGALADESLNPDEVLSASARFMHDFEEKIRADERSKYQEQLQGMREAPRDRPVGSSAGIEGETVPTGPRRYHEAVERAMARRRPGFPVG